MCPTQSESEDDTPEDENVNEIQTYKNNGEENEQENKLLTTNFEVNIQNRKDEGLITYSTDQQIFRFKVNSATNQELCHVYIDFKSNQNKWTIHGILQRMCFYVTTENPNVMMRESHNTQSDEYKIICQEGLYILSTTPEEILNMLQGKYKINMHLESNFPHDPGGRDICQIKESLAKLYAKHNMLFKDKLPRDRNIVFQISKLLIEKGI